MSAYSTSALGRPLVVLTPERATSVYRQRFTSAHELGHLVLHRNALPGDRQQEREADEFAAEFLTPSAEIGPLLPPTMRVGALRQLGQDWGVSVESLIRRMGELRRASDTSVRRAYQRLRSQPDDRSAEPASLYPGETPQLLSEAIAMIGNRGFSLAQLADELQWSPTHVEAMLGAADARPRLQIVT